MAAPRKSTKGGAPSGQSASGTAKAANRSKAGKAGTVGRSGRISKSHRAISPVSGRFVSTTTTTTRSSTVGKSATKKSAPESSTSVPAAQGHKPATDPLKVVVPGIAAEVRALAPELAVPQGILAKLVDKHLLLEVLTGSGKAETVTIGDDLAAYLKALSVQLNEVVLPSVLARLVKGAPPIPPEKLAERMLAVTPAPAPVNKMAEQVGPEYYDTNGVRTILAAPGAEPVSKQAVEHRRNRHTILALQTIDDRRWIYPTWQFRNHDVLPGMAEVLATFYPPQLGRNQSAASAAGESGNPSAVAMARSATGVEPFSRWSVATWVTTPLRDLDGLSVADWLLRDRDRNRVVQLARRTAAAWTD